jgi:tetratricopeptide (TPR) repeat protein
MVIEDNGELQHQFLNTVNDFKGFIKKYPNSSLSRVALTSVANSYWLISQRDGVMNYNSNRMHFLEEIINDRELNSLKGASEVLKVDNYVSQKDFTGAIIQAEDVISKYTNDKELQCAAMLKKGLILSYELNQKEKAAECFRAILKDYQDNPIKEFAENQLKVLGIEEKENSVGILLSKVKDFAAEAYPNPFNPSTTIRYNIPQNGKIVIKVYDLLGREIAELVNEIKQAGSYNVLWNGKNSFGSEVSSGIYFYKIQLNDQAITKKMMLVR